jgi:hypothetical protein
MNPRPPQNAANTSARQWLDNAAATPLLDDQALTTLLHDTDKRIAAAHQKDGHQKDTHQKTAHQLWTRSWASDLANAWANTWANLLAGNTLSPAAALSLTMVVLLGGMLLRNPESRTTTQRNASNASNAPYTIYASYAPLGSSFSPETLIEGWEPRREYLLGTLAAPQNSPQKMQTPHTQSAQQMQSATEHASEHTVEHTAEHTASFAPTATRATLVMPATHATHATHTTHTTHTSTASTNAR